MLIKGCDGLLFNKCEDILENTDFMLPSTVEERVKILNKNGCKRYKCTLKFREKFNAL